MRKDILLAKQPLACITGPCGLPHRQQTNSFVPGLFVCQGCHALPTFLIEEGTGSSPRVEPPPHVVAAAIG
jgi:hypothetical protein